MPRRILIIGNSDGIGAAVTKILVELGDRVVGVSRSRSPLAGRGLRHEIQDVTSPQYRELLRRLVVEEGGFDACIYLRRRARESLGLTRTQCGAVTFVQRFNSALGLNVHFHAAVLDGVYAANAGGHPEFHELPPPEDAEVRHIVALIAERVQNRIARRGLDDEPDPLPETDPGLAALYAAAVRGRIATGPNAGNRLSTLGGDRIDGDSQEAMSSPRCAAVSGFNLHGNVNIGGRDRERLERLLRYAARPAVALERLKPYTTLIELNRLRVHITSSGIEEMKKHLREVYARFIDRGVVIIVNGEKLRAISFDDQWSYPPGLYPTQFSAIIPLEDRTVGVEIVAGLIDHPGDPDNSHGVFVYCNNRLIARGLTDFSVGFSSGLIGNPHYNISLVRTIVKIKGQSRDMPWDSGKSGINTKHPVFRALRQSVVDATKRYAQVSRSLQGQWDTSVFPFKTGHVVQETLDSIGNIPKS